MFVRLLFKKKDAGGPVWVNIGARPRVFGLS